MGKLTLPDGFRGAIAEQGLRELPVLGEHTDELLRLLPHHRDPFDRLLVSQARTSGLTLVTCDRGIAEYDVALLDATV